jgi:hypothetical protein
MDSERQESSIDTKTCEKMDFLRKSLLTQFFVCEYMYKLYMLAIIINLLVSAVHSRAPIICRKDDAHKSVSTREHPFIKGSGCRS